MSSVQRDGFIRFHIEVDPFDMCNWSPARIAMFFEGVAQILRARHGALLDEDKRAKDRAEAQKDS